MLTRYRSKFDFAKLFVLTVVLFALGGAEALGQVNYSGNGNTGFGGVLGPGSFDISDDGTTVTLTFNKGGGDFNDALVVYIDSESGGFANTSNFTDTGDRSRQAVSGYDGSNRSTVNFPAGFRPDFAISANVNSSDSNFDNLFGLVENGGHNFVDVVNINPSSGVGNSTYTMTFDFSEINTSSGIESFSFVATYLDEGNAFRSNEAIGDGLGGSNPGQSSITFDTYFQYSSGKEGGKALTVQTGNWSNASTWANGNVPLDGDAVTIDHNVTLDQNATVSSLDISSGQTFTASDGSSGYTLTLTNGGALTNNGTFDASDGTVAASGSGTVSVPGDIALNNVTASAGINFGSNNAKVTGTLTLNSGGFVDTNPPTYGSSSTLKYNTGGTFGRTAEWTAGATSGAGVPQNVTLSNSTTLDLSAIESDEGSSFRCNGNLTVESGSRLRLDVTHTDSDAMSQPLTVFGKFVNNGQTDLSGTLGGDLKLRGDYDNDGTFNSNGRAVFFTGTSGTQNLGFVSGDLAFIVIDNSGNGVKLLNNIDVTGSSGDVLQLLNGELDLNDKTMNLSGGGGNVKVDGGARTISSSTGTGVLKSAGTDVISTNGGSLTLGSSVETQITAGVGFGDDIVTVNGVLEIQDGGFVQNGDVPNYGSDGTLRFDRTNQFGINDNAGGWGTLEREEPQNLTIDASGTSVDLNVARSLDGTLTLQAGTFTSNGNLTLTSTGESSSARISGNGSGTISGNVTIERKINYAPTDADHWRFMASPLGGALDEVSGGGGGEHGTYSGAPLLSNTWTQGASMTGANYQGSGAAPSVFYYDQTKGGSASNGWTAVGDLTNPTGNSNIASQEGFAVYLFQDRNFDGSNEGFPITLSATRSASNLPNVNTNTSGETSLPVNCTDSDGGDGCTDSNDGWNLVANPFVSHFDWTSGSVSKTALDNPAYVYDADNAEYDLSNTSGGDNFIAPFQAFFVKSNANDGNEDTAALSVGSGAKTAASGSNAEFKSVDNEPLVSLQLSDEDDAEETQVTFRNGAEVGKDRLDGYQLTPLSADYHLLASEIEGRGGTYDSQYRPLPSDDSLTIDLPVTTTSGGTYTIGADTLAGLPTDLQVKVVDTQTGETANLKAGESLTFTVESSQAAPSEKTSPRELLADGGPVQKASAPGVIEGRFDLEIIPASAIPVELAAFDATTSEGAVQLEWKTASETNNAGFAIERRAQGGTWSQVGFRDGAGTTTEAQTYRFTDEDLPFEAEQVRYRLRQKDLDGTTTLSDEVTAQLGTPSEARLHAPFPNPSAQRATVRYEVPQQASVEIAVYDVLGRRVETVVSGMVPAGREQHTVQTAQWAPGTYFVRLRIGDTVQTQRLSVVR